MLKLMTKRKIYAQNAKNVQKNLVVSNKKCNFAVVSPNIRFAAKPIWVDCACMSPANRSKIRLIT